MSHLRKASPETTTIGWMGTGVMGRWMCEHLIKKGYKAVVYNRTESKAAPLVEQGATWAKSPAELAAKSDIVFGIVGFPPDVREVFLGSSGALSGARPGTILVDMTTSQPSLAREIAEAAKAKGCHALDAPVSGGDIGAKNAALSIMVGGEKDVFDAVIPCFEAMGKAIIHQGPAGSGQHTKMVNQVLIGGNMVGVCEALLYGYKAGLNLDTVLQSVGGGAAASWSLNNLGPRILKGDFEPGFFVEHFLKDLAIVLEESRAMGLALPGVALAEQLYRAVKSHGMGRKGTQALYLALKKISNVE